MRFIMTTRPHLTPLTTHEQMKALTVSLPGLCVFALHARGTSVQLICVCEKIEKMLQVVKSTPHTLLNNLHATIGALIPQIHNRRL